MATLSEGIQTALDAVVRSPGGASLKDDAEFVRICNMAAARVQLKLGDVDGSDPVGTQYLVAVQFGMMFGLESWCATLERKMDAAQQRLYDSLRKDWDDAGQTLRHELQELGVTAPDTDVLDQAFPNRVAESEDDDG